MRAVVTPTYTQAFSEDARRIHRALRINTRDKATMMLMSVYGWSVTETARYVAAAKDDKKGQKIATAITRGTLPLAEIDNIRVIVNEAMTAAAQAAR